jgi:hypothetical protein
MGLNQPITVKHVLVTLIVIVIAAFALYKWANRHGNKPAMIRPGDPGYVDDLIQPDTHTP